MGRNNPALRNLVKERGIKGLQGIHDLVKGSITPEITI